MYAGKIVEIADREALFSDPKHPYTEVLLSSIPEIGRKRIRERVILKGDVPNPAAPPSGCRFHPRCPRKTEGCDTVVPELVAVGLNHLSACLREVKRVV
jgi:oligopeptide/dipeptide ABC transporter ATP-binding protein